jgi:hypothetical protein
VFEWCSNIVSFCWIVIQKKEAKTQLTTTNTSLSLLLGAFFASNETPGSHRQLFEGHAALADDSTARTKQTSHPPSSSRVRTKQDSAGNKFFKGVVRRKQVSLDLFGPNDFFVSSVPEDEQVQLEPSLLPVTAEEVEKIEAVVEEEKPAVKLFGPLRFKPRMFLVKGGGGHGGGGGEAAALPPIDEEVEQAVYSLRETNKELEESIRFIKQRIEEGEMDLEERQELLHASDSLRRSSITMKANEQLLASKLTVVTHDSVDKKKKDGEAEDDKEFEDSNIIRATKQDKIKTLICFVLMLALTITVASWTTELEEDSFVYLPIGLACVTYCPGNVTTRDFFSGHNHFQDGEVIKLNMHLDPYPVHGGEDVYTSVQIVGVETGQVKAHHEFGPVDPEERLSFEETITADFDRLDEHHVINVNSTDPRLELSFTLDAKVLKPLADYSELVAALIMIVVYFFIIIEVIHRTLVAVIGSMIALMLLFIMEGGNTQGIHQIMLSLEWSTLGLLFGMMLLVGELSHTGIFEWCAVRLLMASKGSFTRLMVLLCTLTAVASAFLDNVTTMLLVAPVTIDMCNILNVDPRPFLIGEVILSNIGGTATLIGKSRRRM